MTVRLDVLPSLDRREFCRLTASCAAALAIFGACSEDGSAIETGPLGQGGSPGATGDPGGTGEPVDAASGVPVDGRVAIDAGTTPSPDAGTTNPTCPTSPTDTGMKPAGFAMNTPQLFTRFFVVRDSGGLYAISSQCTHESGNTVRVNGSNFRCPRHGATFTMAGAVVSGPTSRALVHYALCLLPNGNVGVSTSQTVATSVRLTA